MAGVSIGQDQDVRGALINDVHERFVHEEFRDIPFASESENSSAGPGVATGDVNNVYSGRNHFQYHVLGAGQTIDGPVKTSGGWNISQDLTDDEGVEYTLGNEYPENTVISNVAGATRGTFTVGTDAPFYFALKFTIADVSGTDDCLVGFRKAEAYQTGPDAYDEWAALNVISGDINIETELNGGGTTTTDTTDNWTDGQTKTLMVICDSDGSLSQDGTVGKCYYFIDGLAPTTDATTRYKFDSGEIVIPFFFMLHATTSPGINTLKLWESGFYPMGESAQAEFGAA